jgi:hypothetical protein
MSGEGNPRIQPIPTWWWLPAIACGIPFLVGFWLIFGEQFRGFIASLSVSVIVLVYGLFRDFSGRVSFRLGLLLIALLHGYLVLGFPWSNRHVPGIFALPFVLGDIGASAAVLFLVTRLGPTRHR